MSFDGIVTNSVVKELNENLLGGRIDKIYQQEKDELLFNIRNNGRNYRLLISASSNNSSIYLTSSSKSNPQSPPMFCMLLRKYLAGGIILDIKQHRLDRIVFIDISSLDELGQPSEKRLIIEVMGRYSNIILIDKDSLKIIDSIKRVPEHISRVRQILPGLVYEFPPVGDKVNPLISNQEDFYRFIKEEVQNTKIYKFWYFNYIGLSPLISKEICFRSGISIDRPLNSLSGEDLSSLFNTFTDIIKSIKKGEFNPLLIKSSDSRSIVAFHALDLNQFGKENKYSGDSISEILDQYYKKEDNVDRVVQSSQSIKKVIQVKLDRSLNKLGKQKDELLASKDRDKYKVYADLISANLHSIPLGSNSIELDNFYDENMESIIIPLDNKVSPVINAQNYYKRYSKLKTAESLLLKQLPITKNEIIYLENILLSIENSTEMEELNEIREELIKEGYLKDNRSKNKRKTSKTISSPHHYISSDNINIYVGKNNRQNDYITLKFAHKDDIWLHVENMPGSHVIIKKDNQKLPESTLEEAALLAAYYSKGRNGDNISVVFTERKNVRKPKNGKPGMVIFENYNTIMVSPHENKIKELKKVED